MTWLIWAGLLPACIVIAAGIVRRPVRQVWDEVHVDRARELFRRRREWLEARFVGAVLRADEAEGHRWEDAHWQDEIAWARDRQSRHFLALVGVHFDPRLRDDEPLNRHATALFEFYKGRWHAEGRRLDQIRPDEALERLPRFERVVVHTQPRRAEPHP